MGIRIDRFSPSKRRVLLGVALLMSLVAVACSSAMCPYVDEQHEIDTWRYQMEVYDYGGGGVQWSPDGSHLVFLFGRPEGRDIFAVGSDGSSLWRMSPRRGGYETFLSADISPDGSRVAYDTSRLSGVITASSEIRTSRLDGSTQRRVEDNVDLNTAPSWSPDGTRIAFAKYVHKDSPNDAGIYIISPDGAQERLITPPLMLSDPTSRYDWGPVWSPDGSAIAFAVRELQVVSEDWEYANNPVASSLYRVEADGLGMEHLFADPEARIATRLRDLTWSPGGRNIAFSYSTAALNDSRSRRVWDTKLYIIGRDGEGLLEIPGTSELVNQGLCKGNRGPCVNSLEWSPDGAEILLSLNSYGIYIISVEDFEIRKVSERQGYAAWSPGGSRIAVSGRDYDAVLVSMLKDGSDVRVLVRIDEDGLLAPGNPG